MSSLRLCLAAAWLSAGCAAFGNTVEHPPAGDPNAPSYCKIDSADENTCGACTAKPGCGYCAQPKAGSPSCQPGVRDEPHSPHCDVPLAIAEPECPAPPPLPERSE